MSIFIICSERRHNYADLSWISALTNQGGGGGSSGGVSDYDQLKNRPVTNIAGTGTVISALETGVYNIEGTWKLTPDDIERETLADDLFYVMNMARKAN